MVRHAAGPRNPGAPDVCQAVVVAVARAEGVDPTGLEPPLGEVVDADALNALFSGRAGGTGRIEFEYAGYHVTVDSEGQVTVEPADGSN